MGRHGASGGRGDRLGHGGRGAFGSGVGHVEDSDRSRLAGTKPSKWGRPAHAETTVGPLSERGRSVVPKLGFGFVLVALIVWSAMAFAAYGLVDGLSTWLAGNAGTIVQGGKDVAGAAGLDKNVVDMVNLGQASGFVAQLIDLARIFAKPLIVVVWVVGAAAIVAVPALLRILGRPFGRAGH